MFQTRVTKMLGIQYPIIQGGMLWLSRAELTAAVSNAGGLGILTSASFPDIDSLQQEIRLTKQITDKPFAVNIPLFAARKALEVSDVIDVMARENIYVAETSGRSPEEYIDLFKQKGIKVMHKVTAVRFARKSEKIGCDIVVIDGVECAGHPGEEGVSSLVLLPLTVDAISIPVIAAGGFADGRGLVAALAMGAEGVMMGTRFMVSQESPLHIRVKEHLAGLAETQTTLVMSSVRKSFRVIHNRVAARVLELEQKGAAIEELLPLVAGLKEKELMQSGDLESGLLPCGQSVGLIKDIPTVKEIIEQIVMQAESVRQKLC